ncbi:hypothetical protein B9Z19DRAFT_1121767 [Tuber borchii]|uniref:C2H2-type domain-containing protein n=1 Tax=Tuber borchii TaxID=42251 RepID=A0A2T7A1Y9_TUBBO|nr:hypothetical protein B9Z19DRAFT_1121767 [Tuber borchii]
MLSLLSLLIVTEGSGDVAAVSWHATTGKGIELCYSKNRPCTPDETAYITKLFAIATDPTSPIHAKLIDLFHLILCKCKDKIITRLHKLCNRLRDLAEPDFSFVTLNPQARAARNPVVTQCDAGIRELVGTERFPLDSSLADLLKRWFQLLLASSQNGSRFDLDGSCLDLQENKRLVTEIIAISYLLSHEPQAASILDVTLLHLIGKVGDYHAAMMVLVDGITKLNSGHESGVSIKEIVPPLPDTQFSDDFLRILNVCARGNGITEITREACSKACRGVREIPGAPVAALKATIHCECSLALAFAKSCLSSLVPTTLVIEISKSTCWLCREFLATFRYSYHHITIHVPPCSGELRSGCSSPGCTLPPRAPSRVVNAIRKELQDVIKQVLTERVGTPAVDSDPFAHDSSSSDEFWVDDSYDSDDVFVDLTPEDTRSMVEGILR